MQIIAFVIKESLNSNDIFHLAYLLYAQQFMPKCNDNPEAFSQLVKLTSPSKSNFVVLSLFNLFSLRKGKGQPFYT